MNIDSIVSYAIFLGLIIAVIYFISSVYPNFEYSYFLEKTKYEKGIAKYELGKNYEVTTELKCISLPNYFKENGIEVIGNYIISNVSYTVPNGIAIVNGTLYTSIPKNSNAIIYGDKACFDVVISDEFHGNKTSYSVSFTEDYSQNGIEFEKIYRKWLE